MCNVKESWRLVRRVIEDGDVVLEVLDARDPVDTRPEEVEKIAERLGKRLLVVLNKADLVDREVLEKWREYFQKLGIHTVYVSAKYRLGTRRLFVAIRALAPRIPATVVVVGYPNVGKSTIINYLKGRYVAPTSPKPGWTRGEQLVKAKSWLFVLDTPGIVKTPSTGDLALDVIRGLVDPATVDDPVPYAYALLKRVLAYNPSALKEAYGIDSDVDSALEEIGRTKRKLLKGGKVNIDAAARIVLKDWTEGKLRYMRLPPNV
ncbi:MAG: GTPase [Pyrobaculum sp.]|uniref:GTPase n=1 Tax=Pyrobaculum sp. TaxID=2004705 RepID=UPI003EE989ED